MGRINTVTILKKTDGNCGYCGITASVIDHIICLRDNGTSKQKNLIGACPPCNYLKGTKTIEQFRIAFAFDRSGLRGMPQKFHADLMERLNIKPIDFAYEKVIQGAFV